MSPEQAPPEVLDGQHFRQVLGHFATGVTVVIAMDDGQPVGFTCQSFSSLSLDPPLVTVAPQRTSTTWPRIRSAGTFCANILAAGQQDVGTAFARTGTDTFAGRRWATSPSGSPVLEDVLAWVDCEIVRESTAATTSWSSPACSTSPSCPARRRCCSSADASRPCARAARTRRSRTPSTSRPAARLRLGRTVPGPA